MYLFTHSLIPSFVQFLLSYGRVLGIQRDPAGQGCPWGARVSRGGWLLADTEAVTGRSGPTGGLWTGEASQVGLKYSGRWLEPRAGGSVGMAGKEGGYVETIGDGQGGRGRWAEHQPSSSFPLPGEGFLL